MLTEKSVTQTRRQSATAVGSCCVWLKSLTPAHPFLLHCHQAAARAEAEKQRLADAAAQREAEAAQLTREQEAAVVTKARHAAAVKSFFDEQVGPHKSLTDSFCLAACFGAMLYDALHLRDKLTDLPHWHS